MKNGPSMTTSPDARLSGVVVKYELKRLSYDSEGIPVEFRVAITVRVELFDIRDEKTIFGPKEFSVEKDYKVTEDVSDLFDQNRDYDSTNVHTREFTRHKALLMASADVAETIASAMLDTF